MTSLWITKYALSGGIKECEQVKIDDDDFATVKWENGMNGTALFHGNDWHVTLDAAVQRAEEMRKARIVSLKKQIAKLEKLSFVGQ